MTKPSSQGLQCIIEEGAVIGENVHLGHRVIIHQNTVIHDNVTVGDGSVLGREPSKAKTSTLQTGTLDPLVIGSGSQIGAYAILYAGSTIGPDAFIADGAQVRERCHLGKNVVIGHNSTVENDTKVGDYTKLQTAVYLTAKSVVEDHVFLAPMVTTTNDPYIARTEARHQATRGPHIHRGARIAGGAVLLPGVDIGQEAVVAAGAVVTKDVPPYQLVMGIPARVVRPTPPEQLLFPSEAPTKEAP
ncbi:MAG: UDP-3-O-(3-hydroxymyristoyl)glucosamine N-acyltransferase [Sulfobacillus benefaciens]|uniref:UDP-3-O-(3-hydroxymyristoyl)glucosamine N-acyltransferase n=1 Tax=Sulfobacillus benefaciens TaxID=453960 RepID=A0A2T2X9E8_9FIRM|nr:MAG: UDP-3-O-(3-hydroxymyristoyl)glucosamine N-acyltransferase [Sulfobacillus benefaciens]